MSKTQRQPNQTQHLNSLFSLQQGQCNQIQMNSSIGQAGSGRNQTHHPSTLGTSRFNQNLNKLVSMALSGELARALQGNLTSQPNIALGNNTNDDDLISKLQGAEALQQLLQQPRLQSSPETQPGEIVNTKSKSPEGQQSSSLSSEKQDSSQGTAREVSTSASSAKPSKRSRRSNQKREDKDDQIVVVPCRARGMCMEHTFQTAYFEIPKGIKHGDPLVCSFPACRNRGVKFRYCVFCRDPVAKRSFRNRHNHAGEKLEDRTRGDGSKQAKTSLYGTVSSCSTLSPSEDGSGSASSPDEDLPMKRCCEDSSRGKRPSKSAKVHDERMAAWELLLANRPDASKDKEITVWLDQVMLVSDARKPFSAATSKMKPCYYKKR